MHVQALFPTLSNKQLSFSFYSFSQQWIYTSFSTGRAGRQSSRQGCCQLCPSPPCPQIKKHDIKANSLWFLLIVHLLKEAGCSWCWIVVSGDAPMWSALPKDSRPLFSPALGSDPTHPSTVTSPPQTVQACQWEMNGFAFLSSSFLQGRRTAAALPIPWEVSPLLL